MFFYHQIKYKYSNVLIEKSLIVLVQYRTSVTYKNTLILNVNMQSILFLKHT